MLTNVLGKRVKDSITGFTGIVTQILHKANGNVQYGIQPVGDGNTYPDAMFIDYHTIEIVDDGVADKVTPITNPTTIKIGDEIQDKITKYRGIVTEIAIHLNGCQFLLTESLVDKANKRSFDWISVDRVVVIKSQKVSLTPTPKELNTEPKVPGGPGNKITAPVCPRR